MKAKDDPPSSSGDLEAKWRQLIAAGLLARQTPESLVTALQDLGPVAARDIRSAIGSQLSTTIMTLLHKRVGKNHPNNGEEIIERVHGELIDAIFDPSSSDGTAMRKAFYMILNFRIKDAIATEFKHSRIPTFYAGKSAKKRIVDDKSSVSPTSSMGGEPTSPDGNREEPVAALDGSDEQIWTGIDTDNQGFEGDDGELDPGEVADPSALAQFRDLEQKMDVERILASIADLRKRAAFRYHMDLTPKKSIAAALDVDRKTVGKWISEVQEQLSQLKEVKSLECASRGGKQ